VLTGQGWTLAYTWSSTPGGSGGHYIFELGLGFFFSTLDTGNYYVTCVR
jgi:hypothetical protein